MEGLSAPTKKKVYNGLDILKFAMALTVVAIHVQPFAASPMLYRVAYPLLSSAVPMFFLISAFLFFRKYYNCEPSGRGKVLGGYCKRIGILYLAWFVIDFGFILLRKDYFNPSVTVVVYLSVIQFVKDLLFGTTYPGFWFLSASVVALLLVSLLTKYLGSAVTFVLSLLLSLYLVFHDGMPIALQGPYNWYATTFRKEVYLSFPTAMVWISMGNTWPKTVFILNGSRFAKIIRSFLLLYFCYVIFCLLGKWSVSVMSLFQLVLLWPLALV